MFSYDSAGMDQVRSGLWEGGGGGGYSSSFDRGTTINQLRASYGNKALVCNLACLTISQSRKSLIFSNYLLLNFSVLVWCIQVNMMLHACDVTLSVYPHQASLKDMPVHSVGIEPTTFGY